mgnify:CR=1 FL=1
MIAQINVLHIFAACSISLYDSNTETEQILDIYGWYSIEVTANCSSIKQTRDP